MKTTLIRLGLLALMVSVLFGCSGSKDGTTGSPGIAGNLTKVTNLTADQWKALKPNIDQASISVSMASGTPVVKFTVTDENGNPLLGLGGQSLTAANAAAGLPHTNYNLAFTLAKLVPVTGGPSKWVTYLVTTPKATGTAGGVVNGGVTWVGNFPQADNQGTLVDNGDGSYQYTFFRDITQTATIVAGLTDSGTSFKADLGDTTYDPALTHRLGIIINGPQPGTGAATPTGITSVTEVPLVNTFNIGFDFVPNGGAVSTTRDIVVKDSCTDCHAGKGIGHVNYTKSPGDAIGRNNPRLCVTCHTDQIKYTFNAGEASSTSGGYVLNGTTRPTTAIVDGRALGNYPNMIHKMHMGEELVKTGYNFNASEEGLFNEKKFPQSPSNCTKCHDGSATAVNKTTNGDNWKNVPSKLACGACHDGINFTAGTGVTLANRDADVAALQPIGTTATGHVGGAQADDSACSSCHTSLSIPVDHEYTVATTHNPIVKTGVSSITYDLKSVTLNGSSQPVVTFQIKKDGVAVSSFNAPGPSDSSTTFQLITGLTRGPTFYVAYAVAQDGITSPADFNGRVGASLYNLLLTSGGSKAGSITGPDGSGYFTATLTGPASALITIPAGAKMVTGLMVGRFEQVVNSVTVKIKPVLKTVLATGITGNTARRTIVSAAKCNNCHEQLGTSPEFHNGERNDPTACAMCHTPNQINDGASATTNYGWPGATNTYIHGIHGASKRTVAFTWAAWDTTVTDNFSMIQYPGKLKNCEQCHLSDTVNFGATGTTVAPNMLYTTASAGVTVASGTYGLSPYVTALQDYGLPASVSVTGVLTPAAATTLVNSPMASACFSCHDTSLAKTHMTSNGGSIYEARSTATLKTETCLVCHGKGRVADVAVIHQR
jgi:OmcA/MtrC family decaheme c-type cytochrome